MSSKDYAAGHYMRVYTCPDCNREVPIAELVYSHEGNNRGILNHTVCKECHFQILARKTLAGSKAGETENKMETLTLINGNNQQYKIELPKIVILGDKWNEAALGHVYQETGLRFQGGGGGRFGNMEAQPETSQQIVKLLLTYNFKTQYHNNATNHNTLFLKLDHHVGFKVDSICYECVKANGIPVNGIAPSDRLAC